MNKLFSFLLLFILAINTICVANETKNANLINATATITTKNIDENYDLLKNHHKKYKKYLNKTKHYASINNSDIFSKLKDYKYYNYPLKDNFNKKNKKILIFELQDGDYALLNMNVKKGKKYTYAAEYHENGELFGIVQIKTFYKKRKSTINVFHEYRKELLKDNFVKKHTMIFDVDKNVPSVSQLIYINEPNFDNLICAQINNDVYLSDKSKNILPEMQKFYIPKKGILSNETKDKIKDVAIETMYIPVYVATSPIWLPLGIYYFSIRIPWMLGL